MMLEWLGEKHDDRDAISAAEKIETAVDSVLEEGKISSRDLGGHSKTYEVGDEIARKVRELS
jgi:isocitrate/isopropylmalate dehydrogenase